MTDLGNAGELIIEPVVSWSRAAVSGRDHLVEADLRVIDPPGNRPSAQPETTFSFVLDGAPYLQVRSVGNPTVAVDGSGRTTGPVRFVVTPRGPSGRRVLRLTLCSSRGRPLRTDELVVDVSVAEEAGGGLSGSPSAGDSSASAEEQRSWQLAENFSAQAHALMRLAERAAEEFRAGRRATRRQFEIRQLSQIDADIRWAGTAAARKALADNKWYTAQAEMYLDAAKAQYARARYLQAGATARVAALRTRTSEE